MYHHPFQFICHYQTTMAVFFNKRKNVANFTARFPQAMHLVLTNNSVRFIRFIEISVPETKNRSVIHEIKSAMFSP